MEIRVFDKHTELTTKKKLSADIDIHRAFFIMRDMWLENCLGCKVFRLVSDAGEIVRELEN